MKIIEQYDKEIENFKTMNTEFIKSYFEENAHIAPFVAIFFKGQERFDVTHFLLSPDLIEQDAFKRYVAKKLIPDAIAEMAKTNSVPLCICWTSEVWMRETTLSKGAKTPSREELMKLPPQEGLMIAFETALTTTIITFFIDRPTPATARLRHNETATNKDTHIAGLFSNLFKNKPTKN